MTEDIIFIQSSILFNALLFLVAQQSLRYPKVVDHLCDTKKRSQHDHPSHGSLEKCRRSFHLENLFEGIHDPVVVFLHDSLVEKLQPGLHHVSRVDHGGGDGAGRAARDEGPPEDRESLERGTS